MSVLRLFNLLLYDYRGLFSIDIQEVLQAVFVLAAKDALTSDIQGLRRESVVIVCGTGYVMPEARAFLGVLEPR